MRAGSKRGKDKASVCLCIRTMVSPRPALLFVRLSLSNAQTITESKLNPYPSHHLSSSFYLLIHRAERECRVFCQNQVILHPAVSLPVGPPFRETIGICCVLLPSWWAETENVLHWPPNTSIPVENELKSVWMKGEAWRGHCADGAGHGARRMPSLVNLKWRPVLSAITTITIPSSILVAAQQTNQARSMRFFCCANILQWSLTDSV